MEVSVLSVQQPKLYGISVIPVSSRFCFGLYTNQVSSWYALGQIACTFILLIHDLGDGKSFC